MRVFLTGATAVAEEGVTTCSIADAIGQKLGVPTRSLDAGEAANHLGWLAFAAVRDVPASIAATQQSVGWRPMERACWRLEADAFARNGCERWIRLYTFEFEQIASA